MGNNKLDLPLCDKEILEKGRLVFVLIGKSVEIEEWVKKLAKLTNAPIDWHMVGGRAYILHLGDDESLARVNMEIKSQLERKSVSSSS
ncbi:MAG: hypothetical protein PHN19_04425 [Patescibacteria group bacterium]|nr:hypothetical protein [Patescibacteria group bacterium]